MIKRILNFFKMDTRIEKLEKAVKLLEEEILFSERQRNGRKPFRTTFEGEYKKVEGKSSKHIDLDEKIYETHKERPKDNQFVRTLIKETPDKKSQFAKTGMVIPYEKAKALLNFWYAKDLPNVYESVMSLKGMDKLVFKHISTPFPTKILQKMIDDGLFNEYDYLIITSTDLEVKQENLDTLLDDIKYTGAKVISGICNVDRDKNKDKLVACMKPVDTGRRDYEWIKKGEYKGIKEVKHNGMALIAIHKDIFKSFKFHKPGKYHSLDIRFSNWCNKEGIPMYVNFDNEMLHFHKEGDMLAGVKEPEIWFKGKQLNKEDYL